jgi:hypothetical protein
MSFDEPNHRVSVKANPAGMTLPAPSPTFAPVATEEATPRMSLPSHTTRQCPHCGPYEATEVWGYVATKGAWVLPGQLSN